MKRCKWADSSALYKQYHDEEWGVPVHDDRTLFEFLILEELFLYFFCNQEKFYLQIWNYKV